MNVVQQLDKTVNQTMETFLRKPSIVKGVIHMLLLMYAARIAPTLPPQITDLFTNSYFRLFVFSLILWTAQVSPVTSVLIALAFMVSVNYANQKPLFEFLENEPVVAMSKETAIDTTVASVQQQVTESPIVTSVTQESTTMVIQPSIINGPEGTQVVTPSVVVAPVVVSTPSGEQMVIKPDVTLIETPSTAAPSATAAPMALAPEVKMAPSTTEAPSVVVAEPQPATQEPAPESGCYPIRKYDMAKVEPNTYGPQYLEFRA